MTDIHACLSLSVNQDWVSLDDVLVAGLFGGQRADEASKRSKKLLDALLMPHSDRTVVRYSGDAQQARGGWHER